MRSILKTITFTTIFWVSLILIGSQILIDRVVSNWLLQQFDIALESKARALVTLTKFDGNEVELDFADEFMPEFEDPARPEYFSLLLDDGTLLENSRSWEKYSDPHFKKQAVEVEINDLTLADGRLGRGISIRFIPQIENKGLRNKIAIVSRPVAILKLSRERESLDQQLFQLHSFIIAIGLVVIFAITLIIIRTTRSGLSPLLKMKQEVSRITPQSIDRRIKSSDQPAEIEPIASQFNLLLGEIENALKRERQFSSDVAHELRTPVSEIRSLAEVGLRWPDEQDIRSYFADIHESSSHLGRLIENLLLLNRSEEGKIKLEYSEINLEKLLNDVCLNLTHETQARKISIALPTAPLPRISSDPHWLSMLLNNLLFNAISHSPENTTVSISTEAADGYCSIEITNEMEEPLSTTDMELVFKRFWRRDSARESGQHAGIGLSLVRSYVECMEIEVNASITADGYFAMRLSKIKMV